MFEDAEIVFKDDFKILSVNVRSLNSNFTKFIGFLNSFNFKFHILALTETWINSNNEEDLFAINGYKHMSTSRSNRTGGGCRIYYLEHLIVKTIKQFSAIYPTHEALFVDIKLNKESKFVMGLIYRPPQLRVNPFIDYLRDNLLSSNKICRRKVMLFGDWNVNLNAVNNSCEDLINLMVEKGYNQYVKTNTYCSSTTGLPESLLDHVWTNFDQSNKTIVFDFLLADHLSVGFSFCTKKINHVYKKQFRDYSHEKLRQFDIAWNNVITSNNYSIETNDVDYETERFEYWLTTIINQSFPIKCKQYSQKRLNSPWIDTRTVKLIRKKHILFIKLKINKITYSQFNHYSKSLKKLLEKLRIRYYNNKFKLNNKDSKKQWKTINNVISKGNKFQVKEIETVPDGDTTNDKKTIANTFNNFFVSIGTDTQSELDPPLNNYDIIPQNNNSITLNPTIAIEVDTLIKKLKNKNGLKDLPVSILKRISQDISPIITQLFNLSIEHDTYPSCLKTARVTPIFKKGNTSAVNNYRPISVLPTINKIFEKLLHKRLLSFLDKNNILSKNQFGFTKAKDTQQAALKLIQLALPSLGNKKICGTLFLDFSKAFDTVDHNLLLHKLNKYGIRGKANNLFASYLSGRKQFVGIDGINSEVLPVHVGVPQGSVLGPLLFILYTNDLNYLLEQYKKIFFADDTTVFIFNENPDELIKDLRKCTENIIDWCNYNKLSLNCTKTKLMIFTNRKVTFQPLIVKGKEIERVKSYKYLGLHIDEKLKHKIHLKKLTAKMSSLCYATSQINRLMQPDVAKMFYYGMVYSKINYGILVWGGALLATKGFKKLGRLHEKIIFNLMSMPGENRHNDINKICKRNGILKLVDVYKLNANTSMYKTLYSDYNPDEHDAIMHNYVREHNYNTRNRDSFRLPFPRVKSVKINYLYQAINSWNQLPNDINLPMSMQLFKNKVKNHFLSQY
jgi:hypothetical protein